MTYIKELEIDNRFGKSFFGIEYIAIQTDSKGMPLVQIKFTGVTQNAKWFKDKIKSKSL
jgi:hypothetical protein